MSSFAKTFKIGTGGNGLIEVQNFISRTLGRDLSLIRDMTTVSLNERVTNLTITYDTVHDSLIETSNPVKGEVSSTTNHTNYITVQFTDPIAKSNFTTGKDLVAIDGTFIDSSLATHSQGSDGDDGGDVHLEADNLTSPLPAGQADCHIVDFWLSGDRSTGSFHPIYISNNLYKSDYGLSTKTKSKVKSKVKSNLKSKVRTQVQSQK